MNNKGMTLGAEICIIVLFALLAFFTIYSATNSFGNSNNLVNYKKIENDLEKAARNYISDKMISEKTIVTADTLKKLNLFNNVCNGYVVIDNDYYEPYIKCNHYETPGYSSVLAN